MLKAEQIKLIRKGNELFNKGAVEEAKECFIKSGYNDGIRRVADYYLYDKKALLDALPLYIKCKSTTHVDSIYKKIAETLSTWLSDDNKIVSKTTDKIDATKEPIKKPIVEHTNKLIKENIQKAYVKENKDKPEGSKSVKQAIEEDLKRKRGGYLS